MNHSPGKLMCYYLIARKLDLKNCPNKMYIFSPDENGK